MMKHSPSFVEDCLTRQVIFVTGKGGVGKSTVAWAMALACRKQNARVTVASWNPLDSPTGGAPTDTEGVRYLPLDANGCFREYASRILKFETLYNVIFENHVLQTFIRATPGIAETVLAGKIWDLWEKREQDLLIVDLPSSGHAVSFFQSPLGVHKIFAIGFVHKESEKIVKMLKARTTRIDLVALPEELPVVEGVQLKQKLVETYPFNFGFLHLNQCTPDFPLPEPLPADLSAESRVCLDRHVERIHSEREAISLSTELDMPTHNIPRFPAENRDATLQKVAAFLENA